MRQERFFCMVDDVDKISIQSIITMHAAVFSRPVIAHRLLKNCDATSTALPALASSVFSLQMIREKQHLPTYRRHPPKHWMPRDHKHIDENLTQESKEFIQEYIQEKYLKPGESPLKQAVQWERGQWEPGTKRTGVIARKIGVYPMWKKNGERMLTTLLQVVDNHVIKYHPPEVYAKLECNEKYRGKTMGKGCLVVGAESADPQRFTAAYAGLFREAGVLPKMKLTKFMITPNAALPPGTPLDVTHFRVGDYVDVCGTTIDHGFQGVMKRWGFKGGPASHGCTKSHRKGGSMASGRKRGLWKGTKMAGPMGNKRRWLRGQKIVRINTKYNVIWIKGPAVAGDVNGYVYIKDSVFKKHAFTEENHPPFPTHFPEDDTDPLPEEMYAPEMHSFSDPTITTFEQKAASK